MTLCIHLISTKCPYSATFYKFVRHCPFYNGSIILVLPFLPFCVCMVHGDDDNDDDDYEDMRAIEKVDIDLCTKITLSQLSRRLIRQVNVKEE